MIPKTLHYMWFGSNSMPRICGECIESWHKVLPSDWSFQFWDEDNYDIETKNNFVLQAYSSGNYAFVSDYARWDILHRQGGVYVDTDVFLLKDITPLLQHKAFGGRNGLGLFASGLILGGRLRHHRQKLAPRNRHLNPDICDIDSAKSSTSTTIAKKIFAKLTFINVKNLHDTKINCNFVS